MIHKPPIRQGTLPEGVVLQLIDIIKINYLGFSTEMWHGVCCL